MFLHGFEQRRLGFGRCSIYLIGQQHLCEDRPFVEDQIAATRLAILLNDVRPGNVSRHQVRSELNAMEREAHRFGKRSNH